MSNSCKEFNDLYTDFIMDFESEAIEKIKKDRTFENESKDQLVQFFRRDNEIEIKYDDDYKAVIFQVSEFRKDILDEMPKIKLDEPFDLQTNGMHVGKFHIYDKRASQVYSYFFTALSSSDNYYVIVGKTSGIGDNVKLMGMQNKEFSKNQIEDLVKNISSLR